MATFVLIHGAWHGGWCFEGIKAELEARGHCVLAPDLPGMGGDDAALAQVSLAGWADFTLDLCRAAAQRPVVLVGHSRGGIVISEAAESDPQAMDALVYISALMTPDAKSRAAFNAAQQADARLQALVRPTPGKAGTVIAADAAGEVFAQLSPPDKIAAALSRLKAEPRRPLKEQSDLSAERWGSLPRTYIECTEDRTIPLDSQRLMHRMQPGTRVVSLPADHMPFYSMPDVLVDALEAAIPR